MWDNLACFWKMMDFRASYATAMLALVVDLGGVSGCRLRPVMVF